MSNSMSRRDFFTRNFMKNLPKKAGHPRMTDEETRRQNLEEYFKSPLYSYPLLQEMPWNLLLFEAKSKGIDVKGRSKNEIAKELFQKVHSTDTNTRDDDTVLSLKQQME